MTRVIRCVTVSLAFGVTALTAAAQTPRPIHFRLFLVDGTEVATHGEVARFEGQVIATVPVTASGSDVHRLQAVTIPDSDVDWARTDAYAATVRLAQYTAATAERDYAAFTEEIGQTLASVSSTPDPLARVTLVTRARDRLSAWPHDHYGYRQHDAQAMLTVLDEVLAGLRAAAGQQHFTLTLASGVVDAPARPALKPPSSTRDLVTQTVGLSRHVRDSAERVALLEHALRLLDDVAHEHRRWSQGVRRDVRRQLDAERRDSRAYTALRTRVLERASGFSDRGDVRALLALRDDTKARGARLGSRRPSEMAALLAHVELQLERARQWRLVLDRWEQRQPLLAAYSASAADVLHGVDPVRRALGDIRTLSGPSLAELDRVEALLAGMRVHIERLHVPAEAASVQALFASALQMTGSAVRTRRLATQEGSLARAWEASAAAAGALMTLDRTRDDLAALAQPPRPAGTTPGRPH